MSSRRSSRHARDRRGERQEILRFAKERIGRDFDRYERQARHAERQRNGGSLLIRWTWCAASGQRVRQLGRDDAAAADRRVAHHADVHGASFSSPGPDDRLADDDALGERDAGKRAELRVAALDELSERRRGQPRRDRAVGRGAELAAIAVERVALALVVLRDVDDERRGRAVVDEVVADPVRPPGVGVASRSGAGRS